MHFHYPTSSTGFVCYSHLYKDVYDRALSRNTSHSFETVAKTEIPPTKPQFIQIRSIGIGAASSVYLVQQTKTKCIYAMKVIARTAKSKQKQFLQQEFKIHLRLSHPNIISLYHIYNDEGSLKLVLQYAQYSLMDILKQRIRLTQKQASCIVSQILKGIDYIHSKGIAHRDIKLQNILLVNGVAKICDFGLASRSRQFSSSDFVGTVDYLSPQIVKESKYTYKTDIWAVGVILWQLVYGASTFLRQKSQADKYMQLIKMDTNWIDYSSCSFLLSEFFKRIFTSELLRAEASQLLRDRFITQNQNKEGTNSFIQF